MMFIYRLILIVFTVLFFPVFMFIGCDKSSSLSPEESLSEQTGFLLQQKHETSLTREERNGQVLYEYYCSLCHGKTGGGDGFNSFSLDTPPAKHTNATLMATLSDSQINLIIRDGGPALERSPEMPPWGGVLTNQEISDLTLFIRTLAQQGKGKEHVKAPDAYENKESG